MRLDELFDSGATLQDQMQQAVQDMLTPLIAMKAPFVTVQQVIERLRDENTGLAVDRATVMQMLDPAKVSAVKSIEGDKVFLQPPDLDQDEEGEDQKARDAEKIEAKGTKQAQKMAKEPPPAPPPAPPAPPAPPPAPPPS